MKLISLHITGFGKYTNYKYTFDSNLTTFIEDNGGGKSTLADFIKAMLYGMDIVKKNGKDFKDREHYAPFEGGVFGGNIVFEHNGHTYRLERTFDLKSPAKDKSLVYIDSSNEGEKVEDDFVENLLGLDKESFERLLFISSNEITMESNGNIKKNLNNIIGNTSTGYDYDEILENINKVIQPYSGKNSPIKALETTKKELLDQINNQETVSKSLTEKYSKLNELTSKDKLLKKQQALFTSFEAIQKDINRKTDLEKKLAAKSEELAKASALFPKGVPSTEEINTLKVNEAKVKEALLSREVRTFPISKEEELHRYEDMFKDGIISSEELIELSEDNDKYYELITLQKSFNKGLSNEEEKVLDKLADVDIQKVKEEGEKLYKDYKETPLITNYELTNKKSPLPIILMVVAALLIVSGIVLLFIPNTLIIGIVLSVLGIVGLIASLFLKISNKPNEVVSSTNKDKVVIKEQSLHLYINRYTALDIENIEVLYHEFNNYLDSYASLSSKKIETEQELKELDEKLSLLKSKIEKKLYRYIKVPTSYNNDLSILKNDVNNYSNLKNEYDAYIAFINNSKSQEEKSTFAIKEIDDKYDLGLLARRSKLDDIIEQINNINQLQKEENEVKNDLETFLKTAELKEIPAGVEIKNVQSDIDTLAFELVQINNEIETDENFIDSLEDNKEKLSQIQNEINELKHHLSILENTRDSLEKAEEVLDKRYVKPVMDKFNYYANKLNNLFNINIRMGRNFDLKIEVNGAIHSIDHLSSGQKSVVALAFRLALLENIYNGGSPFVIMDDPFMSLDPKNMTLVSKLIKDLAENQQIIYLSCADYRDIK